MKGLLFFLLFVVFLAFYAKLGLQVVTLQSQLAHDKGNKELSEKIKKHIRLLQLYIILGLASLIFLSELWDKYSVLIGV